MRSLRNVQAWHVAEHGFLLAGDESIVRYATRHRMLVHTDDAAISPPRFPVCTHGGAIIVDMIWRDPDTILTRPRLIWRSGLRARLPHSVTTIDNQGVKILGRDPGQRHPYVFLVRPSWTAPGAYLEPAPRNR